eukprot:jgi/Mesvir1/17119/Mv07552-RA.1
MSRNGSLLLRRASRFGTSIHGGPCQSLLATIFARQCTSLVAPEHWPLRRPLRCCLIAGEPSGDVLGARLLRSLKAITPFGIHALGIGGDHMVCEGLESVLPMADISVMGIVEVVKQLPRLRQNVRDAALAVHRFAPDVIVTIDAKGFNLAFLRALTELEENQGGVPVPDSNGAIPAGNGPMPTNALSPRAHPSPIKPSIWKPSSSPSPSPSLSSWPSASSSPSGSSAGPPQQAPIGPSHIPGPSVGVPDAAAGAFPIHVPIHIAEDGPTKCGDGGLTMRAATDNDDGPTELKRKSAAAGAGDRGPAPLAASFQPPRTNKPTRPPRIQYVPPSVWAYRHRAASKDKGLGAEVDHMLCLLPFEPRLWRDAGVPATFVGHPVVEDWMEAREGAHPSTPPPATIPAPTTWHIPPIAATLACGECPASQGAGPQGPIATPAGAHKGEWISTVTSSADQEPTAPPLTTNLEGKAILAPPLSAHLAKEGLDLNIDLASTHSRRPTEPGSAAKGSIAQAGSLPLDRQHSASKCQHDHARSAGFQQQAELCMAKGPVLALLPGSRHQEVTRLLPIMRGAVERLLGEHPGASAVIPTLPCVERAVREGIADWPIPVTVAVGVPGGGVAEHYSLLQSCDVAVVASGTAALQVLAAGLPQVVIYRAHPLTQLLAWTLAAVSHVSLPNILLGRPVLPEAIFWGCTPDAVADWIRRLLADDTLKEAQRQGREQVMPLLGRNVLMRLPGPLPSARGLGFTHRDAGFATHGGGLSGKAPAVPVGSAPASSTPAPSPAPAQTPSFPAPAVNSLPASKVPSTGPPAAAAAAAPSLVPAGAPRVPALTPAPVAAPTASPILSPPILSPHVAAALAAPSAAAPTGPWDGDEPGARLVARPSMVAAWAVVRCFLQSRGSLAAMNDRALFSGFDEDEQMR